MPGNSVVVDGVPAALRAPVIELLGVVLRAGSTTILDGVDLAISGGAPTVLIGPNGAGKTSLLRLMMGLAAPTVGELRLAARGDGRPVRRALVFQKPVMLRRSAAANVAFALQAAGRPADQRAVGTLLRRVGLAALAERPARRLSGGEQQRLALARALAREPDLLLLDEPASSLDPAQANAVEEIIAAIADAGVKVVLATHDLGAARRLAGEIVLLVGGQIAERGPAAAFFSSPTTDAARRFLAGEHVI